MTLQMPGMAIVGYVDRWSTHHGQILRFFVSTEQPDYQVQLMRLIHGDPNPIGPGIKEEAIDASVNGSYQATVQHVHTGSCMIVDGLPKQPGLTVTGSLMATLVGKPEQTIVSLSADQGYCLALSLSKDGHLTLEWFTDEKSKSAAADISLPGPALEAGQWYDFTMAADLMAGSARIALRRTRFHPHEVTTRHASLPLGADSKEVNFNRLILGARSCITIGRKNYIEGAFNGRLSAPQLWRDAAKQGEICGTAASTMPILASWNFVDNAGSDRVPDTSGNGLHGRTINRPTRLITGPAFDGTTEDPSVLPEHFNAVHFHDDDLSDAGWQESFRYEIPSSLASGVYAMKLSSSLGESYIPFFVTPKIGQPTAKVAILIPTVSYQVYANGRLDPSILPGDLVPLRRTDGPSPAEIYVDHYGMRSCYDCHNDGTGVAMATMLRPMPITVHPQSRSAFNSSPHQLGADLYIIDWLEEKGIKYDIITDHELNRHGASRLADYNAVLSGTHAEYWTAPMLDGLKNYTDNGGRFIYLSGNGLYWVTALSDDGSLVEIRRDQGTRSWTAAPGEAYISLNGKRGGLWRHRGRAPQKYVGVGFTAMGFDRGRPFKRTKASYTSRAAVLFNGIEEEIIGDYPAMVSAYGAAGYEFDRADTALGTPSHALILATASGFTDCYQLAVEEAPAMAPGYGGSSHPDVRADIVFFETPNGGAVFSTSAIAWCSTLSYNGYDNSVSRLTENVVRAFMADGPLHLGSP